MENVYETPEMEISFSGEEGDPKVGVIAATVIGGVASGVASGVAGSIVNKILE